MRVGHEGEVAMLMITSPSFRHEGAIPKEYTCEGRNISPPLEFEGVPAGAKSLVLIVDDPDAPDPAAPKAPWVHWIIYNLPPSTTGLTAGTAQLPPGSEQGLNDWKKIGYGGPCPPKGRHRYVHKLYALDRLLEGVKRPTKLELEPFMQGHVLATAELVGTYQKQGK
jgi:Raf kinase inhibitor-like YbhB/YbcL family protein